MVVSSKMDVIGGTMLHEMLHWDYLITPITEGEPLVDWEPDPDNWPEPPSGYDACNTMQINRLSTQPEKPGATSPESCLVRAGSVVAEDMPPYRTSAKLCQMRRARHTQSNREWGRI
jgi:hypothetical protein